VNAARIAVVVLILAATACAGPSVVTLPTADGTTVIADRYGSGDHAVILAHGGRFDRHSWIREAKQLAAAGYGVTAIDFRSAGRDSGARYDLLAAVDDARARGARTISVVGASFGGTAAAEVAVMAPGSVDNLVLLASSVDEPERLDGRKLVLVARGDVRGDGMMRLLEIEAQYARMPEPKQLVVVEGIAHAQYLFESVHAERVMQEILKFLEEP
jgi:pimeloyl-ACP methyl ester carboxylesterase